jgi:hypothetical protein
MADERCRRCDGTGGVMTPWRDGFGLHVTDVERDCHDCDGTGSHDRYTWTPEAAEAFERATRPVEPRYDESELDGPELAALYDRMGWPWRRQ